MDLLTKWIDRSAQLRIASLDATRTARSLCLLHDLEGEAALRFSQAVAGSLLLASDLKPGLTLSLQIDLGEVEWISSSALGKLIALKKRMQAVRGNLRLRNVSVPLAEVFRITRLDLAFIVED